MIKKQNQWRESNVITKVLSVTQPIQEMPVHEAVGLSRKINDRFAGIAYKYPGLKIISGHWGEMVPFFLNRMDDMMPMEVTGLKRTISQTYRDQVYVTPSGMLYMPNFLFCKEVLGTERLLFSMDYPYITLSGSRKWLENLPVSEEERNAFAHSNAEKLLNLPD